MQKSFKQTISDIAKNYAIMQQIRPLSKQSLNRFHEEFAISSSYNSNAIEGNTFTYDETRLLIKEGVVSANRNFREHEEIIGYKKAIDFLYQSMKDNKPINEQFILKLHSFVLPNDEYSGKFRDDVVFIGDLVKTVYIPPKANEVPDKITAFISELQNDLSTNRKNLKKETILESDVCKVFHDLAKHHIEFERIHPFFDGNGRTGRLLLTYEMITLGFIPVDIRYEDRINYYSAFKTHEAKEKYSTRDDSKTEPMAKLIAQNELDAIVKWNELFHSNLAVPKTTKNF